MMRAMASLARPPCSATSSSTMNWCETGCPPPPYSLGQLRPSQPFAPSFRSKSRAGMYPGGIGSGSEAWSVPSSAARNSHTSARRRSSESLRRKFMATLAGLKSCSYVTYCRGWICSIVMIREHRPQADTRRLHPPEVADVQYRARPLGGDLQHRLEAGPPAPDLG